MTEIKKIIDKIQQQYQVSIDCTDRRDLTAICFTGDQAEHIISALHEQAEREKGCEWCTNMGEYNRFEHYRIDCDGHAEVHAHMVMANISRFCPMCGRRLEEVKRNG